MDGVLVTLSRLVVGHEGSIPERIIFAQDKFVFCVSVLGFEPQKVH